MESEDRNDDDNDDEDDNSDEHEDGFIWAPDIFRIMAEGGMRVRVLPRVSCNAITLFAGGYR